MNSVETKQEQGTPEEVRITTRLWAWVLLLNVIHVVLNAIMLVLDPAALRAAADEMAQEQGIESTDFMIGVAIAASVMMSVVINLLILGFLFWAMRQFVQAKKQAAVGRRIWTIFGIVFILQGAMMFMLSPGYMQVPEFFPLADGSIQIITGVLAALGIYFSRRPECSQWISPKD